MLQNNSMYGRKNNDLVFIYYESMKNTKGDFPEVHGKYYESVNTISNRRFPVKGLC